MPDRSSLCAVVVGGGSGIGAAVADAHRARGTEVSVWDVAGARDITCDISSPDQIDEAADATITALGTPAWLTVTAGIGYSGSLADDPVEAFDHVMRVNTRGVWLVMRAFARHMAAHGGGSIVATSSVSGRLADRGMGLYCASKAALDMLVRVAAVEWAPAGVRVNAVAPGVTRTPMLGPVPTDRGWLAEVAARTPLGRLGEPDDVAAAVLAVHDLAWVTGQVLDCDGGLAQHSPIDPPGPGPAEISR